MDNLPIITLKKNIPSFAAGVSYKGIYYKVIRPYGNFVILKENNDIND